ncbi:PREDICTED: uncharacterized protein LOC105969249 [Erythranthe guttata]|uniref:uncharacterized protein LOC105969249 n=1 Tax=Erythranthe guttata TaxID=4155 RepID=UPI00064DD87D|nr:PREDICTED: uncharacterized protein LOC105969249 [Erythranthe guttata]|eukprot:XP_012849451.1 PREDICTED: uncharacterized protein LOC105969249 [Erythranthe guttata]
MKKFKENPKLGTTEFRNEVCTTLKASVSKSQAYRAKQKALKAIQGSEEEQFQKIRSYCEELKRTDTNATVVLKLTEDTEGLRFQRLYICFSACKEGFKNACRPVIGVDGCFLKGQRGGQLLAAVGLDPNNNIYPICYAIVEGETKETWMWFLQLLDLDIGFEEQHKWTFMSDKQKGLIPAFETLFPGAENRLCVRHLHSNMKKDGFGGMAIKSALWAAAKATRIEEFKRRMEELRAIDEAAYNWLVKKPPQNWTREKTLKWDTNICPKIRTVLIKNMKEAGECIPMKSDEWNFQIVGMYDQHTVDIRAKSCSCRRWDLTGIPCKHAISAIWCRHEDPEQYVHHCYSVDSYKRAYENSISPINGPEFWPQCTLQPPLPPMYTEKAGRPQKLRRREPDEPPSVGGTKLKRVPRINKCRKCGQAGHNARKCGGKRKTVEETNEVDQDVQESREEPDQGGQESRQEPVTQQSTAAMNVSQRGETQVPQRKMQVRRPTKRQVNMTGTSNTTSTINMQINEGSSVSTPVIVNGGVNFITMSNLRSAFGIQGSTSSANPFTAPRPAKKPTQSKNGSKKTT